MTPKEKAQELIYKFWYVEPEESCDGMEYHMAQQCALIAVDEILENVDYFFYELEKDNLPNKFGDEIEYWESVKYEINKL